MKLYSIEDGYNKEMFLSFQEASNRFLEITKNIIKRYLEEYKNDLGYLDLNMWITVYDRDSMFTEEYVVPKIQDVNSLEIVWLHYKRPIKQ